MKHLPDILPLRPYFRETVWGGQRLQGLYGKELPAGKAIGESFELSAYPERESAVREGVLEGWPLSQVLAQFGGELGVKGEFPLLVKLLDAQDDLSIQVHPDDRYAQAQGLGRQGKMEAWYVLHSDGGRIAYGLKAGVGRRELSEAIATGQVEDAVQFFPVKPGEVVFSPPGTVHALCRGVVVYEVQQSSDLTFRLCDYNRPGMDGKPRQLHIAQALEVIDFERPLAAPASWRQFPGGVLVESEHFSLRRYGPCQDPVSHRSGAVFMALTLVSGTAQVQGPATSCALRAGETALVPAGRQIEVLPMPRCEYLIAAPGGQP